MIAFFNWRVLDALQGNRWHDACLLAGVGGVYFHVANALDLGVNLQCPMHEVVDKND